MCKSIDYYNVNGDRYIEDTVDVDMSGLYGIFEKYLGAGDLVLDIGCGSGRDSVYFRDQGYEVFAHDGSQAMVDYARKELGDRVALARFEDFDPVVLFVGDSSGDGFSGSSRFKGLWACSSLLHVAEEDLVGVIKNYVDWMAEDGVFFMSFKHREGNHEKNGRVFTNFTREKLNKLIEACGELEIVECVMTGDVRDGRSEEGWISVLVRKTPGP